MLSGVKALPGACAKFFCCEFLPLSLADRPAFKEFVLKVNGALTEGQLPSRKQITHYIEEKAPIVRAWIKEKLKADIYGYSITLDKWAAGNQRSFYGITAHKTNTQTGIIDKYIIDVSEFEESATAENIALHVNDVFNALRLSTNDVITATCDTEAAQLASFDPNRTRGLGETYIDIPTVPCAAHVLDRTCKTFGKHALIEETVNRCKQCVRLIKKNLS
jgi:hypothetical protein